MVGVPAEVWWERCCLGRDLQKLLHLSMSVAWIMLLYHFRPVCIIKYIQWGQTFYNVALDLLLMPNAFSRDIFVLSVWFLGEYIFRRNCSRDIDILFASVKRFWTHCAAVRYCSRPGQISSFYRDCNFKFNYLLAVVDRAICILYVYCWAEK